MRAAPVFRACLKLGTYYGVVLAGFSALNFNVI
jgi:hypothetical protein